MEFSQELSTDADGMRRWLAGRQRAEAREQQEVRRHPMSTDEAIASALALLELAESLHGWPLHEDAVTRRETAQVRETWRRLHRYHGRP